MGIFSRCDNCGRPSFFSTCLKCEADAANRVYRNRYHVPEKPTTDFDKEGYDREGYDREGYDREGYDKYGYNRNGFDKDGKPAPAGVESFKKFSENPIIRGTSFKLEEIKAFVTADSRSLSYLDDREFTINGVERKDYDENKGIKIATSEDFDIQGEKVNKFHTTRQAIVGKFLNDGGEPTALFNAVNQPGNSLKVKIFKRKSASGKDYFDLDQC
jgi:hypothetical protein